MSISVVTVTRNDLSGLRSTLASVGSQTHPDVQHVIIDGDSSDGSAAWVLEHPAVADTTLVSEPDGGIYDAMNKGLGRARQELVIFMNSGDEFADPNVLADVWSDFRGRDWSWAYGDARRRLADGAVVNRRSRRTYSWLRQTFWRYDICHQSLFARRHDLLQVGGFDAALRLTGDYAVSMLLGRQAAPRRLSRTVSVVLAGGVSEQSPRRILLEAHQARVDALRLSGSLAVIDAAWTRVMVARAEIRQAVRRSRDRLATRQHRR